METKFTKGEWKCRKVPNENGGHFFWIQNGIFGSGTICTITPGEKTDKSEHVAEANAKLISAAPDLLEALRELVDAIDTRNGNRKAYEMALKSIKKSTE